MPQPFIDPEWYELNDNDPLVKARNVRGPSGMIIGRILRDSRKTSFSAQRFNRGQWQAVGGEFLEFDEAANAASKNI